MIADSKRKTASTKWTLGLPESPMPVYYWAKLIGLAPFTLKNERFYPASLLAKIYSTSLVSVHLLLTSMMIFEQLKIEENPAATSIMKQLPISGVAVFVIHVVPSCISIVFLTIGKKVVDLLDELRAVSDEMKGLGIVEDYGKTFKNIFASTVTANIIVGASVIFVNCCNSPEPPLFSMVYFFKSVIHLNTIFIFAQILIFISRRFALVNEKLCDGIEPPDRFRGSETPTSGKNPPEDDPPGIEALPRIERIEMVGAVHSKLCDLVDKTTQLFAGPILLSTLQYGCVLVLFSYLIYSKLLDVVRTSDEEYVLSVKRKIWGLVLLMAILTVQLFGVAHISATTCRQGNAIKVMLFKVWNTFPLPELKNEFGIISLQMLQKPVAVSAFGFFDLGYSYPCKIFGVVLTYLIVIIQLDETRSIRPIA